MRRIGLVQTSYIPVVLTLPTAGESAIDGGNSHTVLVIDDTSLPKKGHRSVGVAPQYASALGKTANWQTLVSLSREKLHQDMTLGPLAFGFGLHPARCAGRHAQGRKIIRPAARYPCLRWLLLPRRTKTDRRPGPVSFTPDRPCHSPALQRDHNSIRSPLCRRPTT